MLDLNQVRTVGDGLLRPEGVMVSDDGTVFAADARGCLSRIGPDGSRILFGNLGGFPNGICLDTDGRCIVANIGNGQVQSVSATGEHTVLMTEADGKRMKSPNFPFMDFQGRLWVSNSTDKDDLDAALRDPVPDGSLVVIEPLAKPRVVAEGIYFANGVAVDADESHVYVAETMMRRVLRYRILEDSRVGPAEVYGPDSLGEQGFPDGIAFDEAGHLWVTFPVTNAVGYIDHHGKLEIFVQDPQGRVIVRPANICFGGPGRKTAYIGSLGGSNIPCFEVPWPGMRLVHQKRDQGER